QAEPCGYEGIAYRPALARARIIALEEAHAPRQGGCAQPGMSSVYAAVVSDRRGAPPAWAPPLANGFFAAPPRIRKVAQRLFDRDGPSPSVMGRCRTRRHEIGPLSACSDVQTNAYFKGNGVFGALPPSICQLARALFTVEGA